MARKFQEMYLYSMYNDLGKHLSLVAWITTLTNII